MNIYTIQQSKAYCVKYNKRNIILIQQLIFSSRPQHNFKYNCKMMCESATLFLGVRCIFCLQLNGFPNKTIHKTTIEFDFIQKIL